MYKEQKGAYGVSTPMIIHRSVLDRAVDVCNSRVLLI